MHKNPQSSHRDIIPGHVSLICTGCVAGNGRFSNEYYEAGSGGRGLSGAGHITRQVMLFHLLSCRYGH